MSVDIFNDFHHYDNDTEVNLGREKLKPYMQEGEVFITNAIHLTPEDRLMAPIDAWEDSTSVLHNRIENSGNYESVRVLEVGFDRRGNEIPYMRAIVGVPKNQPNH